MEFLLNVFGVGVSCRNLYSFVVYLYVNSSGSITSVGEERANLSAVVSCNYVVSVWRGFLFLWVLGMGYVILLWHSLSLPYNYFVIGPNFCSNHNIPLCDTFCLIVNKKF